MTSDDPVLVLVNPMAGSADDDLLDEVCRALADRSPSGVDVRAPVSKNAYAEAVASASGRDVVVVGGDGSVHRMLQELFDQQLLERCGPVGLVPLGTGNDMARDSGIPLGWKDAVDVALGGRPSPRGLLVDQDGGIVANVVHCGVAAEATRYASEVKGVLGKAAYVLGVVRAGLTREGWHLSVRVDGRTVVDGSRPVLMASVAIGSTIGGGTVLAPQSRHEDGLVDVIVARGTSMRARIGFARDLRKARHLQRDDVTSVRGQEVVVEAVGPRGAFRVNADGDVTRGRTRLRRWAVRPGAWVLRVPD